MDNNTIQTPAPAPAPEARAKPEKKADEEFSLAWHIKVLAVIYACLAVFYVILKIALK
jgi:hypothetical protein